MITRLYNIEKETRRVYQPFTDNLHCPKWYHKMLRWLIKKSGIQLIQEVDTINRIDIDISKIPSAVIREMEKFRYTNDNMTIIMGYDYYEKFVTDLSSICESVNISIGPRGPVFRNANIICCPNIEGFLVLPYKLIK